MLTPAEDLFSLVLFLVVLSYLEGYMVITLTQNIYEHEKCNIDMPVAEPFMCFILHNVVSILIFNLKDLVLKSGQFIHCLYFFLLPLPPAFWPCAIGLEDLILEMS